jgi:hypothetical protein
VGGLVAIGFPCTFHLFTLSWNGRGLFALRTLERIARDHADPTGSDWVAPNQLSASGIGEFAGRMISIVGLWGGTGHTKTSDGWRLDIRVTKDRGPGEIPWIEDGFLKQSRQDLTAQHVPVIVVPR